MKPPAIRNFVPLERMADKPRPPTFYQAQPKFSPAPISHFKANNLQNYTPFQAIPEHNPSKMQLPLREVNNFRTNLNVRGQGNHYNRSTVSAKPYRNKTNSFNDPRGYGQKPYTAPLVTL